jgi:hypothetical protein
MVKSTGFFEGKCLECQSDCSFLLSGYCVMCRPGAELREKLIDARESALIEAASICRRMVIGGRAWTHEQAVAADALFAAADAIDALRTANEHFK